MADFAAALDPTKKKPDPNDPNANLADALSPPQAPAPSLAPAAQAPATAPAASPATPTPTPAPAASTALPAGATDMGNNLVRLANGQVVDRNHPLFQQAMTAGAASSPASAASPTPGASAAPSAPVSVNDAFKQSLIQGLTQQAPTANSPDLKPQMDAFSLAQTRAKERAREALAERAGTSEFGANSGAFANQLAGLDQAQGESEANFNAGLVGNAAQQQKQQLLQWAALAGNQLSGEDSRALQERLANLDAQIRREGIAQQGSLGEQDLSLRDKLGSGQLNLGLLTQLLGNQQFGQQLGANLGMFQSNQNNNNFWQSIAGLG